MKITIELRLKEIKNSAGPGLGTDEVVEAVAHAIAIPDIVHVGVGCYFEIEGIAIRKAKGGPTS